MIDVPWIMYSLSDDSEVNVATVTILLRVAVAGDSLPKQARDIILNEICAGGLDGKMSRAEIGMSSLPLVLKGHGFLFVWLCTRLTNCDLGDILSS